MPGAQGHSPPCCWVGALPHTDFPPLADLGVPGLPGDPLPRPGANFGGLPALFRCCFLDIPTSPHLSPVKSRPTEHTRKLRPRERRSRGLLSSPFRLRALSLGVPSVSSAGTFPAPQVSSEMVLILIQRAPPWRAALPMAGSFHAHPDTRISWHP